MIVVEGGDKQYLVSYQLVIGTEKGSNKDFGAWHFFFRKSVGQQQGLSTYGDNTFYGKWEWRLKNSIDVSFLGNTDETTIFCS